MQIEELIKLVESRLRQQSDMLIEYNRIGDIESIIRTENDITDTKNTLIKLKLT